jgi:hypothetical protein
LVVGRNSSIRQCFSDRASQKGCYRFLNNEQVSEKILVEEMVQRCSLLADQRHLIVIQDTSSFNLNTHYYRLKKDSGIGPIEDNFHLGFFMHASLVMDAFTENMLGFSDVHLWHRIYDDPQRRSKTKYFPIEQKESFKWIASCERTREKFAKAQSITFVEDRDGDIYEQFARVYDNKTHLVIRSRKDRRLTDGSKLYATIHNEKVCGNYQVKITADPRNKKVNRTALLYVRYKKAVLKKPDYCLNKSISSSMELNAVEAEEQGYNGRDKIHWRLLTTHTVNCFEDAMNIIECYRKRWYIEQMFRLLKKQGFEMEASQLESGWAIRKLAVLALNATLRILQLMYAGEDENAQPIDEVFTKQEQKCLLQINKQQEGKTSKLSNPYKQKSLVWAKWIIARLGGWKGYKSQRNPGPITLKRGMDNFTQIFNGWCLALKLYQDVGTQ